MGAHATALKVYFPSVIFLFCASALAAPLPAAAPPVRRPNVVLILTDDQGWGDLRCHGNGKIDTPVLDRLAAAGARFDRFYVSPVCAPTRASLLTGRYHLRTGVSWVTAGLEAMRADEVTLADALGRAGYATGCFGKWHNGAHHPYHPRGRGFGEFFGFCGGHWVNYFDTTLEHDGAPARAKGFITDALTDKALAFVDKHRARPFFCYLAYNAPHGPFQAPDALFDKYRKRGLDAKTACVYAMVENVDANVGRLLKKLDGLKLTNDTIVLFTTDNGPSGARFNGGMRGAKASVDEGGVRVPLFVRWPGRVKPGLKVEPIAAHIDVYPTLLELCAAPRPKGPPLDGRSLAPLLLGRKEAWPERLLFTHQSRRGEVRAAPGAVRSQRHCLVVRDKGVELYDLVADPGQKKNIAAEHPDVVKKLKGAYDAWLKDVTRTPIVRLPIPVGHPRGPVVELPAPECAVREGLRFRGGQGWAHDWLTGWASTDARAAWDVEVLRPGTYEVTLRYACPKADVGSKVRVEVGGRTLDGVVAKAHDPRPVPSPDRVPRGEVYEKEWGRLALGVVKLEKGKTRLTVRALSKAGAAVMDLKAVEVRRK